MRKKKKSRTGNDDKSEEVKDHPEKSKGIPKKMSFLDSLSNHGGEGFEQLVFWLSLFFGAWSSSGVLLKDPQLFSLCLIVLAIPRYIVPVWREKKFSLSVALGVSTVLLAMLYLFAVKQGSPLPLLLCCSLLLIVLYFSWPKQTPNDLILRAIFTATLCVFMWVTGLFSQYQGSYESFHWEYFLIGLIPGTVLGARELIWKQEVFIGGGWTRTSESKTKKKRPGSYTRLVLAFLILGPVVPALLLPFSILPHGFLVASLAFYVIPKIALQLEDPTEPVAKLSIKVAHLSGALSLGLLIALLVGF